MARMSRRESQQQTRERIKRAAEEVLASQGANSMRIEQIVRAAGYTRGAFYKNFVSRLDLLLDIMRSRETEEIEFWTYLVESTDSPDRLLPLIVRDSQEISRTRALISVELQMEAERNPEFRPYHAAYLDLIYGKIEQLLTAILKRCGKGPPHDLKDKVIGIYSLGLTLGLATIMGSRGDWQNTAFGLARDYLQEIVASAPTGETSGARTRDADWDPGAKTVQN